MTIGEVINQMAAQLKSIDDPRMRRFVGEQVLLRGLGMSEHLPVGVCNRGGWVVTHEHPTCKAADVQWDEYVAKLLSHDADPDGEEATARAVAEHERSIGDQISLI